MDNNQTKEINIREFLDKHINTEVKEGVDLVDIVKKLKARKAKKLNGTK